MQMLGGLGDAAQDCASLNCYYSARLFDVIMICKVEHFIFIAADLHREHLHNASSLVEVLHNM